MAMNDAPQDFVQFSHPGGHLVAKVVVPSIGQNEAPMIREQVVEKMAGIARGRSFVLDLETSEDARKVASAVINLAKSLDLKVVAEGVETEGQNRILREFGCDQLQGYLFAKPMSAKALALWAMDDVGPRTMNFRDSLFKATQPAEP